MFLFLNYIFTLLGIIKFILAIWTICILIPSANFIMINIVFRDIYVTGVFIINNVFDVAPSMLAGVRMIAIITFAVFVIIVLQQDCFSGAFIPNFAYRSFTIYAPFGDRSWSAGDKSVLDVVSLNFFITIADRLVLDIIPELFTGI